MNFDLRDRTILLTIAGSRAYGIHTPESDVDVKGVAIPPTDYLLGYLKQFMQADDPEEIAVFADTLSDEEQRVVANTKLEGSVYELRKLIKLAADCNPNILDVLFCRDAEVRLRTKLGDTLRANRELFLSARAKHTFSGYAHSQLNRIKGHRAWLLNPPSHEPTRAEYGLPEFTLIPRDHLAAAEAAVRKKMDSWEIDFGDLSDAEKIHIQIQVSEALAEIGTALGMGVEDAKWLAAARITGLNENLIHVMQKEREYAAAHRHWKQYQTWKTQRNADRAALEAAHGYDTKHAGHLYRLLKMCREILETGEVHVWRGQGGPNDAEEVRAIRNGMWDYDTLVEWATVQDTELTELYKAKKYVVRHSPDRNRINDLCVEMLEIALTEGIQ